MKHLAIVLAMLLAISVQPAEAKLKKVGQAGFKFLSNPVGARSAAMGNAYMAMAQDVTAIFSNPAGLARLEHGHAFFDATKGIADINYYGGAVGFNMEDYGVLGIHTMFMDYGELKGTRVNALSGGTTIYTGDFSPTAFVMGLSYAKTMTDRFGFGMTLKWARVDYGSVITGRAGSERDPLGNPTEVTEKEVAYRMDVPVFDVGVLYYTHVKGIRFGAAFRNFSKEQAYVAEEFSLPLELKFGVATDLIDLFALQGLGHNHAASFSSDFQHSRDYSSRLHYGVEYWYRGALALRGGYKSNYDQESTTFGAGLRGSLENYAVQFDYAYNDFGLFSTMHKFTIGLEF